MNPSLSTTVTFESSDDIENALFKIAERIQCIDPAPTLLILPSSLTLTLSTKTRLMSVDDNYIEYTEITRVHKKVTRIEDSTPFNQSKYNHQSCIFKS